MTFPKYFYQNKYELIIFSKEMRMSHWVNVPIIKEVATGNTILNFTKFNWDLHKITETLEGIDLLVYKYPSKLKYYTVKINLKENFAIINDQQIPISEIAKKLIPLK